MMNKIVVGIDVGFSGAIAVVTSMLLGGAKRTHVELYDMPTLKVGKRQELDGQSIKVLLSSAVHVFIEKAQVMPKQGVSSSGRYMKSAGIVEGICVGLGIPYTLVTPQQWKKEMMMGMPKEKEASIYKAKQLYPDLALSKKKDHGKADALLIVLYGQKQLIGGQV